LSECLADKEGVGVVLKLNSGAATELDKQQVKRIVGDILREVRPAGQVWPKFTLVHGHLNDQEMIELYTHEKIKAMVSLTHGEGYGLPLLEQAVCAKPIIATNWSGHTEFLGKGKWLPVEHRLGTIHQTRVDNKIFMPDAQWAFPLEQAFKKRVLKFLESPELPTQWASDLAKKLIEEYSSESCFAKLSAVLPEQLKLSIKSHKYSP
jgi:glycosyltransferase involved in cell wall biosynthesis